MLDFEAKVKCDLHWNGVNFVNPISIEMEDVL